MFPLEVVRRRMQTLAAEGLSQRGVMVARQAVLDIWARERLRGFYAGMLPNTVQVSTSRLRSRSCVSSERGSWMPVQQECTQVHRSSVGPDTHPRDVALATTAGAQSGRPE